MITNKNVPGGYKKQKSIFFEIPTPRARRKTSEFKNKPFPNRSAKNKLADKVNLFTTELATRTISNDLVTPAKNEVLKTLLRKQGKENLKDIISPDMENSQAFTYDQAAAVMTACQMPQKQLRNIQRAAKNVGGRKLFTNEKAIYQAIELQSKNISLDSFEQVDIQLQIKRQGQEKYVLENKPLVFVKDIKKHIELIIRNEASEQEFEVMDDGSKRVIVGLTADAGGGSMKFSISLMHNKDDITAKDHLILMYEAADTLENTVKCLSKGLYQDMINANDSAIAIENENYFIHFQGVFDFKAQDELLGAQGSTCVSPCAKCMVSLKHLQNHGGKEHSKENCPEVNKKKSFKYYADAFRKVFRMSHSKTLEKLKKGDNSTTITTLEAMRKNANKTGSVISLNLLPFTGIIDIVDPLLHIYMGLCNNNLDAMKKDCRALDKTIDEKTADDLEKVISQLENKVQEMQSECDKFYICIELLETISRQRLMYIVNKNELDAEKLADKLYKEKMKNKLKPFEDREVCKSKYCLLFPLDRWFGHDMKFQCSSCKQEIHYLCEGLTEVSETMKTNRQTYRCNNCSDYSGEHIEQNFLKEQRSLEQRQRILFQDINNWMCKVNQKKYELDLIRGPAEKTLEESFKNLKIAPMSYHGGSLNGKDCEKIMINARNSEKLEDFEIVKCLSEQFPERAENYWKLFKILGDCWSKLSVPPKDESDLMDKIKTCEEWSKQLPVLFPERNITRKGHVLSFHVPEFLKVYPNLYYRFFKLEQRGEALHAKVNKMERTRFSHIKPETKKVGKMMVELERLNNVDKKLFTPREYKKH